MNKIFGGIRMKWITVILFAVITGIYTGLIMLVPALKETSFQDIGISYEWWVLFAVIIVVNCEKSTEAMIKCFVFFLISQPLVYAVEIVFGNMTLHTAIGYYEFWFKLTLLCLPGGFLAFYAKKQNLFGSIVLGLGNTILCVMGLDYCVRTKADFPHHLLTAIFCFAAIAVMSIGIQKKGKYRLISAIAVPLLITVLILAGCKLTGRYIASGDGWSFP